MQEMYKILDMAALIGCYDVGFVGLMAINNYSTERKIDIAEIMMRQELDIIKTRVYRGTWVVLLSELFIHLRIGTFETCKLLHTAGIEY